MNVNGEPTIERMESELRFAGWIAIRKTIWQSPSGLFYLGPYEAWMVMTGRRGAYVTP